MVSRYNTPSHFSAANASALVCSTAASPSIAAARCGTIPSVQPNAAATLIRDPRVSAAASVYSTPVPGDTITISEVIRKASDIGKLSATGEHGSRPGAIVQAGPRQAAGSGFGQRNLCYHRRLATPV